MENKDIVFRFEVSGQSVADYILAELIDFMTVERIDRVSDNGIIFYTISGWVKD